MNADLENNKKNSSLSVKFTSFFWKQAVATVASCMLSVSHGFNLGISSGMLPQLRADTSMDVAPDIESWIASISSLSMIIGALISGPIMDTYGRKLAHIILGLPFIVGWITIGCSSSSTTILLGRIITGISSGVSKSITMVYVGEILDPRIRSVGLFLPGFLSPAGILISHLIVNYVGWRISAIMFAIPAVISCVSFLFLKESPLWLIAQGRISEGVDTFRWFRGTNDASELELKVVLERQCEKPSISVKETLNAACSKSFIKPMLILMVVMINVQLSGVNSLTFYAEDIFEKTFLGTIDPFVMTLVMDSIRSSVCLSMCVIGNLAPRKLTFLVTSVFTIFFNFGLVVCFAFDTSMLWLSVFCLVMLIIFSSAGMSTGWSFVPELLPTNARGFGSGLNSAFAFLCLFVTVKIIPDIMALFGEIGLFTYFGIASLFCGVILSFTLPETNGKTLQSIEDKYNNNNRCNGQT